MVFGPDSVCDWDSQGGMGGPHKVPKTLDLQSGVRDPTLVRPATHVV